MHPQSDPLWDRTRNLLIKSQLLSAQIANGKAAQSGGCCDTLTSSLPHTYSVSLNQSGSDGGAASFSRVSPYLSIEQNTNETPRLDGNTPSLTDSRLFAGVSKSSFEFDAPSVEELEY